MPIQHASDNILKRMGRRTSKQELTDIVAKLRREIPDIALRTTLLQAFLVRQMWITRKLCSS